MAKWCVVGYLGIGLIYIPLYIKQKNIESRHFRDIYEEMNVIRKLIVHAAMIVVWPFIWIHSMCDK